MKATPYTLAPVTVSVTRAELPTYKVPLSIHSHRTSFRRNRSVGRTFHGGKYEAVD